VRHYQPMELQLNTEKPRSQSSLVSGQRNDDLPWITIQYRRKCCQELIGNIFGLCPLLLWTRICYNTGTENSAFFASICADVDNEV
jgi:hypothetical protein